MLIVSIKATLGWMEPLLQRIKEEKRAVLVPIIDVIDLNTLQYFHGSPESFQIGSFTWSGHFSWMDIPKREIARRGSRVGPTNTPTMVKTRRPFYHVSILVSGNNLNVYPY